MLSNKNRFGPDMPLHFQDFVLQISVFEFYYRHLFVTMASTFERVGGINITIVELATHPPQVWEKSIKFVCHVDTKTLPSFVNRHIIQIMNQKTVTVCILIIILNFSLIFCIALLIDVIFF